MNFKIMKYIIAFLLLIFSVKAQAAHWFTFYVYYETEYIQGPWSKTDILDQSNYKYLTVEKHEKLLGTVDEDLVDTLIATLKENKPELYNWNYDLKIQQDLVEITIHEIIENPETIKNELIATIILNNFDKLKLNYNQKSETLTLEDLTLPYMDLVFYQSQEDTDETSTVEDILEAREETSSDESGSLNYWLIASVILNIAFIGFFLLNRNR